MDLRYPFPDLMCRINQPCSAGTPTTTGGAPTSFSIIPDLPIGMTFDGQTGTISGTPVVSRQRTAHTVFASNAGGSTSGVVNITVTFGLATCAELQAIAPGSTATIQLMNDLDCAGLDFQPLQDFRGTLDGRGFVIRNLDITARDGGQAAGLFATANGATVQDLGLVNARLTAVGVVSTGLLIGQMTNSTVRRSFSSGALVATDYAQGTGTFSGGLVGLINGTTPSVIEDSFSRAAIAGGNDYSGGLVGVANAGANHEVRRTYAATPSVTTTPFTGNTGGSRRAGALLAFSWSTVANSFGVAQSGLPFAVTISGLSVNNVGLVANAAAPAVDGGVGALQGMGLATRPPFQSWDFTTTWQETSSYPTLRGFTLPPGWDVTFSFVPASQRVLPATAILPMQPVLAGASGLTACQAAPVLPAGLTLDPSTCVISGTATGAAATTIHRVTGTSSAGQVTATVVLMAPAPTSIAWPQPVVRLPLNQPATLVPLVQGGAVVACSSSPPLPAGLSLGADCTISGTPTALSAPRSYAVTARGEHGATSTSLNLGVVTGLVITSCAELQAIPPQSSSLVQLANDVDCGAVDFRPLQDFNGSFDGQGFVIRNLRITSVASADGGAHVGLFGTTTNASLSDVGLVNARVTSVGAESTGALVGLVAGGAISRVFVSGAVVSTDFRSGSNTTTSTGGLVGQVAGTPLTTVQDSFSRAFVAGGNDSTGGLAGAFQPGNSHDVRRSYVAAPSVTVAPTATWGSRRLGAFLPQTYGGVRDSFALAQPGLVFAQNVYGTAQNNVGLVGNPTAAALDGGLPALQGTGLSARAPFQSWDFTLTWQESPSSFPTLRGFLYPAAWDVSFGFTPAYQRVTPGSPITPMAPVLTGASGLTGCTITPALPAGLALTTGCAVQGTSSAATSTVVYTVSATSSAGPVSAQLVLLPQAPAGLSYAGGPFTFDVTNGAIAPLMPTITGGAPTGYVVTPPLPQGLVLDPGTGVISGTPTRRAATATYTVTAHSFAGQVQASVVVTVLDPSPELTWPAGTISWVVGPAVVPVEPLTRINVASASVSPPLPAGLSFDPTTAVITGAPTTTSALATYTVTAVNAVGTMRTSTFVLQVSATPATSGVATTFAVDAMGRTVSAWRSGSTTVLLQLASQPPGFAMQTHVSFANVLVAKAPGTGVFVIAARAAAPAASSQGWWALRVFDALGQATSPVFTVPASDSWGDVAISDQGRVAIVSQPGLVTLATFDAAGLATSTGAPSSCGSSSYGVHIAMTATGRGVATCQGHQGDAVRFRRFDVATAGLWLDPAWTAVAASVGASSWYDSHLVGINPSGDFVITWANYTASSSRASLFNAAGALVMNLPLMTTPTSGSSWIDIARSRAVRVPAIGNDLLIPLRDGAFGTAAPFFNGYARVTPSGVIRGIASGAGFDTATMAIGGSTPWLLGTAGPVQSPFALIP